MSLNSYMEGSVNTILSTQGKDAKGRRGNLSIGKVDRARERGGIPSSDEKK